MLEILATGIKQEEEINGIQIGIEEIKVSLFADDKILCVENPKHFTRKLLELINKFSKIAGYKINIQKSVMFLYTSDEQERKTKRTIPFTIKSEKSKILRNKLNQWDKRLVLRNL